MDEDTKEERILAKWQIHEYNFVRYLKSVNYIINLSCNLYFFSYMLYSVFSLQSIIF